jgi:predicted neuraminidase
VSNEFIFEKAPFPQCHASTIAETKDGLISAWFGGTREKHPDVGIWVSHRKADGWSAPIEVATGASEKGERLPCWNPVLFQPKGGPLLLFYKVGPSPSRWWGMLKTSSDSGKSWSEAKRLPRGVLGPIKNKPMQLSNGDLLCPSSSEENGWRVHFERTSDLGQTWTTTGPVNDGKTIGAIQPAILFLGGEKLRAVGRTEQHKVFAIDSQDNGKTWAPMRLLDVPNPNSGIDAVTLKSGIHVMICNLTTKGRSPLNVVVSPDGETWKSALTLEEHPGKEFSYPAVIQTSDGKVHVTYTWERRRIKHVVLDPSKFVLASTTSITKQSGQEKKR